VGRYDAAIITALMLVGLIGGLILIGLLSVYSGSCQVEPGGLVCF
jgi:hypothetical protein